MRLPNKYGTITKLSGKRRKPYIVKEGLTGERNIIGYASTREEGLIILARYNQIPWDLNTQKLKLKDVYELWIEKKSIKLPNSNITNFKSAYNKYCFHLSETHYKDIKAYHMQDCIEKCDKGYATQSHIKRVFTNLDKLALELDISTNFYSKLIVIDSATPKEKTPFTEEEVQKLWDNLDIPYVDTILILLYTSFRISELLKMKIEKIDLENLTFTGGVKTKAGKDRIVPIHTKIVPFIKKYYNANNELLFNIKYSQYRNYWNKIMFRLNMKHTPHECRHTFRTYLDNKKSRK